MTERFIVLALTICSLCVGNSAAYSNWLRPPPEGCKFTIEKDGHQVANNSVAVAFTGRLNQLYCRLTCPGIHIPPALTWNKGGLNGRKFSENIRRISTAPSLARRISILNIRNMAPWDMGKYTCSGYMEGRGFVWQTVLLSFHCQETMFMCDTSKCVNKMKKCDGKKDCQDGSDESNCCGAAEVSCDDTCIPSNKQCNGFSDCINGEDEEDCPCEDFLCPEGMCINNATICNGYNDCRGGEDEIGCQEVEHKDYDESVFENTTCGEDCINKGSRPTDTTDTECSDCATEGYIDEHTDQVTDSTTPDNGDIDEHTDQVTDSTSPDYGDIDEHTDQVTDSTTPDNETITPTEPSETSTPIEPSGERCIPGYNVCLDGITCYINEYTCDGYFDCPDREDEEDCNTAIVVASVTSTTGSGILRHGDTTTFTCNVTRLPKLYTSVEGNISVKTDEPKIFSESAPITEVTFTVDVTSEWHESMFTCKAKAHPSWDEKKDETRILVYHAPTSLTILHENITKASDGGTASIELDQEEVSVQLTCVTQGGFPRPHLVWKIGDEIKEVASEVTKGNTISVTVDINAPSQLIGQPITCEATTEQLDTKMSSTVELIVPSTKCAPDQFVCNDGECIDTSSVNNGFPDCSGGEDETASVSCIEGQKTCSSVDHTCITIDSFCDDKDDCADGADEQNCGNE